MFNDEEDRFKLTTDEIYAIQEFLNKKVTITVDMTEEEFNACIAYFGRNRTTTQKLFNQYNGSVGSCFVCFE